MLTSGIEALRKRWWVLLLSIVLGAGAAAGLAAYRADRHGSTGRYEADATINVHDSPLVYFIPPLALPHVDTPDGMRGQFELASSPATMAAAARSSGVPLEAFRTGASIQLGTENRIAYVVQTRGKSRAQAMLDALLAAYRTARRNEIRRAATSARDELLRRLAAARLPVERSTVNSQLTWNEALRNRPPAGTLILSSETRALDPVRSTLFAGLIGAAAGLLASLLAALVLMCVETLPPEALTRLRSSSTPRRRGLDSTS